MTTPISNSAAGSRRWLRSPVIVALTGVALYATWFALFVAPDDPARRALIGERFLNAGAGHSPAIDGLRGLESGPIGYDGQFELYVALAPIDAHAYIDNPAYRYGRILYPLTARAIGLGQPAAIPWTLMLVNIAATALLTLCSASYLRRRGASPWYALIIGLSPGLYAAVSRDLTEPLAYALVALGMLVLFTSARRPILLAGVVYGFAGLTRESTLMFAIAAGTCLAVGIGEEPHRTRRRPRDGLALMALACAPVVALKLLLPLVVDGDVVPEASRSELIPFSGLFSGSPFGAAEFGQLLTIVIPSCLALLLVAISVRQLSVAIVALALNVLLFVVLLPEASYEDVLTSSRIALGVPLAFVFCLPLVTGRSRLMVAVAPAAYWMLGAYWVVSWL